jgi:hypothetical protein
MIMLELGSTEKEFSFVFYTSDTIKKGVTYRPEPVNVSYMTNRDIVEEHSVSYAHVKEGNYMLLHIPAPSLDALGHSTTVRFSNLTNGLRTTEFHEANFGAIVSKLKEDCPTWGNPPSSM